MREEILAWSIAWEGHIGLYKSKRSVGNAYQYVPKISLDNTDKVLLDKFAQLVGYGNTGVHRWCRGESTPQMRKDLYHWYICSTEKCIRFCKEILPCLPAKRKQAELMIKFCELRISRTMTGIRYCKGETSFGKDEEKIYQELKVLNKRGIS